MSSPLPTGGGRGEKAGSLDRLLDGLDEVGLVVLALGFQLDGVIPGWIEGVQLMVEGETMRFWIPEKLAYKGERPPYGTLVFDVELIRIH